MTYTGLPEHLRRAVLERDHWRCRWCGVTNRGIDVHHIRYRRGPAEDVLENLVCLCRAHHGFVHGTPNGARQTIAKAVAQQILRQVVDTPGVTGSSLWRRTKRQWALDGRCEQHGVKKDECLDCGGDESAPG